MSLIHKINKDNGKTAYCITKWRWVMNTNFWKPLCTFGMFKCAKILVKVHYCQIRRPLTTENYNSKRIVVGRHDRHFCKQFRQVDDYFITYSTIITYFEFKYILFINKFCSGQLVYVGVMKQEEFTYGKL